MRNLLLLLQIILTCTCLAQQQNPKYNLDFEQNKLQRPLPDLWTKGGSYTLLKDADTVRSGKYAVAIASNETGDDFGSIVYEIPINYEGASITLEGYIKFENVANGFTGLWLRIDGSGRTLVFDNMETQKIVGTKGWTKYSTTLPWPPQADRIFFGGLLIGKGKAWFDDFKVTIDGEDIETLAVVPRADLDTEFDNGSDIIFDNINAVTIDRVYLLGKVWGFLKYHHPEIAKGRHHWDYELLRILPAVTANDFELRLQNWIPTLGALEEEKGSINSTKEIKLHPDTEWIENKSFLPEGISGLLIKLHSAKKRSSHYYLSFARKIGNPIFKHEPSYPDMAWTDDGFKLIALFRYWNMIEYFFPYKHLMDEDWDVVLKTFIPKLLAADDELSYKLTMLELIGEIQDTHANIWQQDPVLTQFHGTRIAPLEVNFVEDKVVVVRTFAELPGDSKIKTGDIITAINGIPIKEIVEEKSRYCPASNRPTQLRNVARKLLRTNKPAFQLTLENESGIIKEEVPTVGYFTIKFWQKDIPAHKVLDEDIGYIYPASLNPEQIDTIMSDFRYSKGLIIDLRCYPSEFIVFSLGKYLMPQPTDFVKLTMGSLEKPGQFVFRNGPPVGEYNENYYKGKVVILVNETTQSSAEYTTMALRVAPRATVIGSTTAAADGNVSKIVLPGNIKTMISGIGVYYPDGQETQRVGILPDIEIHPSIKGIRSGRDELLEKAMELIRE